MKLRLNKLLKNDKVLYLVCFLAFTNLVSFASVRDYDALVLFIALAVLTSSFSKNYIIILSVSMIVTQLMRRRIREGMKEGVHETNEEEENTVGEEMTNRKGKKHKGEAMRNKRNKKGKKKKEKFSSGKIDHAATVEQAYDNLDNVLGKDGINNLTDDTKQLLDQQERLMQQIQNATPILNKAMDMLNSPTFEKMASGESMKGLEGMMEKMNGEGFQKILGSLGGMKNMNKNKGD